MDSKPIHTTLRLSTVNCEPLTKLYQVPGTKYGFQAFSHNVTAVDYWPWTVDKTVDRQLLTK